LSRPAVNCFLYSVAENTDQRETGWTEPRNGPPGVRRKPPIRIDATYQITAWARAPEDEHRLLWRVLAALARHPTLPEGYAQGSLKNQPFAVTTRVARPDPKAHISPADVWQALENRIRPAINYIVTLALEPAEVPAGPPVFTRVLRVEQIDGHETSETIAINGRVLDRTDAARGLGNVVVRVRETGAEALTDESGQFLLARVPRGPITLVASAPDRPEVRRTLDVPAPEYDLEV
jgi:hypothetical protein